VGVRKTGAAWKIGEKPGIARIEGGRLGERLDRKELPKKNVLAVDLGKKSGG
jgi:hypothetical protein